MTERDDADGGFGLAAYVVGLGVTFVAYVSLAILGSVEPTADALGLGPAAASGEADFVVGNLLVLVDGLLSFVVVAVFQTVFLFVALHGGEVVVEASQSPTDATEAVVGDRTVGGGAGEYSATELFESSHAVAVGPDLLLPPDAAAALFLVPPALLLLAGYWQRRQGRSVVAATASVVGWYGAAALLTVLPAVWLFDAVVADALAWNATSRHVDLVVRVRLVDPLRTLVLIAVVSPLAFGGFGACVAEVFSERRPGGDDPEG